MKELTGFSPCAPVAAAESIPIERSGLPDSLTG